MGVCVAGRETWIIIQAQVFSQPKQQATQSAGRLGRREGNGVSLVLLVPNLAADLGAGYEGPVPEPVLSCAGHET